MKTLNYSKQREAVYSFLKTRKDHPTADTVYQNVQKDFPNISRATIYRNLSQLEKVGKIQCIPSDDTMDHYDANTDTHPHFVCHHCHQIIDLEMDNLDFLNTLAEQSFPGKIENHQLVFFGTCENCLR